MKACIITKGNLLSLHQNTPIEQLDPLTQKLKLENAARMQYIDNELYICSFTVLCNNIAISLRSQPSFDIMPPNISITVEI